MTIRNGLFFENNKTGQHAQDVRLMLKALLGGVTGRAGGVVGVDALKVTEKAGTPDMSVDVAPGHFFIEGSRNSAQGTYHGYNDATINVPLSASDPTNPRIDIIYIRVEDSQYDAGFDTLDMFSQPRVAEGTPAAVPDPPTITDEDYIELARVTVGAGVSAIEDADITDRRTFAAIDRALRPSVFQRKQSNGGTYNLSSTSFVDLDNALDINLPAQVGDQIEVQAAGLWGNQSIDGFLDVQIVNSGTTLSGGSVAGLRCWFGWTGQLSPISGGMLSAPLVANDIDVNGIVKLRLRCRIGSAGTKQLFADAANPFTWWAKNLGRAS